MASYNKSIDITSIDNIAILTKHLNKDSNIVFLTGAGVSASCGIKTYRQKNGIYDKIKELNIKEIEKAEDIFTRSFREQHPDIMKMPEIIDILKIHDSSVPSISHQLPNMLIKNGYNAKVITQNIDGLYSKAGLIRNDNLIEFHGSYEKQNIVLYEDEIDDDIARLAYEWCRKADILIVMGTSLKVVPFAALQNIPMKHCIRILIDINPYNHFHNVWTSKYKNIHDNMDYISTGTRDKTYVTFPDKNNVTLKTEWGSKSNSRKYKTSFIFNVKCDKWSKAFIYSLKLAD